MRALGTIAVVLAGSLCVTTPASAAPARPGRIELVSVSPGGDDVEYANDPSPAISADGRFVAFTSRAVDLAPGDTNGREADVFVRDMRAGRTTLVSRTPGGTSGNLGSGAPSISADGRYIAFHSGASDLVPGDTNGAVDVFVRDLRRGRTARVGLGPGGVQADRGGGVPDISADGRHVAFASSSTNLVPGDTNATADIFVRDLDAGRTERVSLTADGRQSDSFAYESSISADGSRVAFLSSPGLTADPSDPMAFTAAYVRDRRRHTTVNLSAGVVRDPGFFVSDVADPEISDDGRTAAFTFSGVLAIGAEWVNSVWAYDLRTGKLSLVSRNSRPDDRTRGSSQPSLSADGRYVAFTSAHRMRPQDTNRIYDIYLRDRRTGGLRLLTAGQQNPYDSSLGSQTPAMSADARRVAFYADSAGLAPGAAPGAPHIYRWSAG
ncbi:hypothetical protein [Actinoplanes sp. NBRC 103695]|uniref:TolB family protein n=1 Tax=Actinoplanes sp. NBRC 103695 TaxID=3032202 RepID=UPI0024A0A1E2|nr:hypothetical protein [Actinoplanes sp. NBRC 103695]GLZ00697.1 hypothetical protein Acsp02_79490 [Actinoplanes sp. NBRC 103695]